MEKMMNYEALQASLRLMDKRDELALEQARAEGTLTGAQEQFSALMADGAFVEQLIAAETLEQAQTLFADRGLALPAEALELLGEYVASVSRTLLENGGELSEQQLEQIAGGFLGMSKTEETVVGTTTSVGIMAGAAGGLYGGAALGSAIFPGVGSVIGGILGAAVGAVVGIAGGGAGGFGLGVGAVKAVGAVKFLLKKSWLGRWF